MKINVNIEFSNQNPLKSNHWNIIFLYLYFRKNIDLGSLNLKTSYRCGARCSFTSFSLKISHFLKILVKFGQNASKIHKINTVSTQSTNCNSEKICPIPPRTNRHGVSYQLHSPPLPNPLYYEDFGQFCPKLATFIENYLFWKYYYFLEKNLPIPPRTNRHGVSYQLLFPPLTYAYWGTFPYLCDQSHNINIFYKQFDNR